MSRFPVFVCGYLTGLAGAMLVYLRSGDMNRFPVFVCGYLTGLAVAMLVYFLTGRLPR